MIKSELTSPREACESRSEIGKPKSLRDGFFLVSYLKAALRLIRRAVVAMIVAGSLLIGPRQVIPTYAASYTATTFAELVTAIDTANNVAGADTISLTADIVLTGNLPLIKSDITFEGNNHSVSGNNTYRVFFVGGGVTLTAPTVTFRNLTIQNGKAQGGSGSGGGAGLGGGMFIYDGNVTVENVTFANNNATGGSGAWVSGGGGMGGNGGNNYGAGGGLWAGANGSSFTGSGGTAGNYGGGGSARAGETGGSGGGLNGGAGAWQAGGGGGVNGGNASSSHGGDGGWGGGGGGGTIGTGGVGGFGGGGGYGSGGNGGFGGGGGAQGNGGFGGGAYGWSAAGYGGASGWGVFGGGAGFGGGLFARDGLVTLTNVAFNDNSANHGSGGSPMGKGGGLFICKAGTGTGEISHSTAAECGAVLSNDSCAVTFSGNAAQDDTGTPTDNDDVFGNLGAAASVCGPDVTLDKTVTPSAAVPNHGTVTYQLVLSNQGTQDDNSVSLSDALPPGVSFDAWVVNPGATYLDGTITYDGALTSSQVLTFTFTVDHTGTYEDEINNTAHFTGTVQNGSDSASFIVEPNYPPVLGVISSKTVDESSLLSFTAAATDGNVNDVLTYTLDSGAPTGAAIDANSGAFTWTPTEAQGPGVYPITVRVTDSGGLSDYEAIDVTVNEVNSAPVLAAIGNKTVNELSSLSFTASATDSDLPANTLTYTLDSGAPTGAAIDANSGAFTWTPTEAQGPGVYPITVRVTDNGSPAMDDSETLTITVSEVNEAPVASGDTYTTAEDTALIVAAPGLLGNDSDADIPAQALNAVLDIPPVEGTLALAIDGSFSYTPTLDFNGTITFTYHANDGLVDSNTAVVTITVTPTNDPPVADNQAITTDEDTAYNGMLTAADVDGDPLEFALETAPVHGVVSIALDGSFTYTPTLDYFGPDEFTFIVTDGEYSDLGRIEITVNQVNFVVYLPMIRR